MPGQLCSRFVICVNENVVFKFIAMSENVIIGNLVVKADPSFGGGELNISGITPIFLR